MAYGTMMGIGFCTVVTAIAVLSAAVNSVATLLAVTRLMMVPAMLGRTVIKTAAPPLAGRVPSEQFTNPAFGMRARLEQWLSGDGMPRLDGRSA